LLHGFSPSSFNVDQPACGARVARPKKQCGLYLEQAKAANEKTFAGLGKGLAYNVTVVDGAGETPRIDDTITAAPG